MTGIGKFQATHSGSGLTNLLAVKDQSTVAAMEQPKGHGLAQAGRRVDDSPRLNPCISPLFLRRKLHHPNKLGERQGHDVLQQLWRCLRKA